MTQQKRLTQTSTLGIIHKKKIISNTQTHSITTKSDRENYHSNSLSNQVPLKFYYLGRLTNESHQVRHKHTGRLLRKLFS